MGFYGNIGNIAKSSFHFDKIYGTRTEMNAAASRDNVYVGRYVLVDYNKDADDPGKWPTNSQLLTDTTSSSTHVSYLSTNLDAKLGVFLLGEDTGGRYVKVGDIILVAATVGTNRYNYIDANKTTSLKGIYNSAGDKVAVSYISDTTMNYYFRCIGEEDEIDPYIGEKIAKFEVYHTSKSGDSSYTDRYYTDRINFPDCKRGYDSTVWQKTYQDGAQKYVMIAELNSVVPTFDLEAEAPTEVPITPHFDVNSTNVYYKLHWQPQWGVMTKGANNYYTQGFDENGKIVDSVKLRMSDSSETLSDMRNKLTRTEYNKSTGETYYYRYIVPMSTDGAQPLDSEAYWARIYTPKDPQFKDEVANFKIYDPTTTYSGGGMNGQYTEVNPQTGKVTLLVSMRSPYASRYNVSTDDLDTFFFTSYDAAAEFPDEHDERHYYGGLYYGKWELNEATGNYEIKKWYPFSDPESAVYFNQAGFDFSRIVYADDTSLLSSKPSLADTISLASTGKSGHSYTAHQEVYVISSDASRVSGKTYYYKDATGIYQRYDGIIPNPEGATIYEKNIDSTPTRNIPDTKEFSMILPSLGNTMAEVWNIIYGNKVQNGYGEYTVWHEEKDPITQEVIHGWYKANDTTFSGPHLEAFPRHTKIAWELGRPSEDPEKLRLIEQRAENGFSFNDNEKVNTVAGAINSVHDLMGMIISDECPDLEDETACSKADPSTIYYRNTDGKFYRRYIRDAFDNLRDKGKIEYLIADPQPTEETFQIDTYYTDSACTIEATHYDASATYYVKHLKDIDYTAETNLVPFEKNKYYYKLGNGKNYYNETSNTNYDRDYSTIVATEQTLSKKYEAGKYWYAEPAAYDYEFRVADPQPTAETFPLKTYYLDNQGSVIATHYEPGVTYYEKVVVKTYYTYIKEHRYLPQSSVSYVELKNFTTGTQLGVNQEFYGKNLFHRVREEIRRDGSGTTEEEKALHEKVTKSTFEVLKNNLWTKSTEESSPFRTIWTSQTNEQFVQSIADAGDYYVLDYEVCDSLSKPNYALFKVEYMTVIIGGQSVRVIKSASFLPYSHLADYAPNKYYYKKTYAQKFIYSETDVYFIKNTTTGVYEHKDLTEDEFNELIQEGIKVYTHDIMNTPSPQLSDDLYDYVLATSEQPLKNEDGTYKCLYYIQFDDPTGTGGKLNPEGMYQKGKYYYNTHINGIGFTQASPQPTDVETFNQRAYYIKNNDIYEKATSFESDVSKRPIYYIKNWKFEGDFLLDMNDTETDGRDYFTIVATSSPAKFYKAEKYYYLCPDGKTHAGELAEEGRVAYPQPTEETFSQKTYYTDKACTIIATSYSSGIVYYEKYYKLDSHADMLAGRQYLIRGDYYVMKDARGLFNVGAVWNPESDYLPCSIELGLKRTVNGMTELEGFSRALNTINGLILEMNKLLNTADETTRDTSTVMGCVNKLKDIIAKFGELKPKDIMIADAYGRIRGADQTSYQLYTWKNVGDKALPTQNGGFAEDQYIYWNINDNVDNPMVTIEHRASHHPTEPSEVVPRDAAGNFLTNADKNGASDTGTNKRPGWNTDKNNHLQLYTPLVDNMGHAIGMNIETVELPYGFKKLDTKNSTSTANNAQGHFDVNGNNNVNENTLAIVADDTQADVSVEAGNRWIRLMTNANGQDNNRDSKPNPNAKLTVFHETHDVKNDARTSNLNKDGVTSSDNSDKITFQDLVFDNAGHVIENHAHTYTLPYGYKTVSADKGTANVAKSTQDSVALIGDSWIQSTAANDATGGDKVSFAHIGPVATAHTTVNNDTPAFGDTISIKDLDFDSKGHKANEGSHTVLIPGLQLVNDTTGNVMTDLSYTYDSANHKGVFTETRENVGTLALNDYTPSPSGVTLTADIVATDTINNALAKVQYQLNALDNATHFRGVVSKLSDITDPKEGDIVYVGVKEYIYYNNQWNEMGDETIYVTKAYATVSAITPAASETISSISQTDGKIAVSKQSIKIAESQVTNLVTDLNNMRGEGWTTETIKANADAIATIKGSGWTNETIKGNATNISSNTTRIKALEDKNLDARLTTIENADLINRVKALEDEVEALQTALSELTTKVNTYHPEP